MQYRLRTLLIVLALGPPLLAGAWTQYTAWKAERERKAQRIIWMVSPLDPGPYSQLPKTVGESEAQSGRAYVGIGDLLK
jgi:hypothetical protein